MGSFKEQRKPHMIKGVKVHFSHHPYQLWLFHLLLQQVPESQEELSSIVLHKHCTNKIQPQSVSWTNRAEVSHKWQREIYFRSSPLSLVPPCRDRTAIFLCDLSRQWEETRGFVAPSAKVLSLSPAAGTRGHSIPARGGLRWLTELRAAFHSIREWFGLEGALNMGKDTFH